MLVNGFATFPNAFLEEMLNRSLFFADKTSLELCSNLFPLYVATQDGINDSVNLPAARLIMPFGEKAAVELV